MVKELDIQVAREAPLGDPYAMPTLLAAVKMLDRFLRSGRIRVWVCQQGRYGTDVKGCELETDVCGWRTWDEAVTVETEKGDK